LQYLGLRSFAAEPPFFFSPPSSGDRAGKDIQISAIVENSPYIGLFLLLILGGLGFPFFPEDATFILCGVFISSSAVKVIPAIGVLYVGVLVADFMIYSFGRKCGRKVVRHRYLRRLLPPERLAKLEQKFKEKGIYLLVLGRHFIGVRSQVIIVSGIMKMPALKFLIIDGLTATLTIAFWTAIGYGGTHGLQSFGIDLIRRIPFLPL